MHPGAAVDSSARHAVHALRRARRSARLGRLEWFEVAYRAYVVVLVGGGMILAIASLLPTTALDTSALDTVRREGPDIVGVIVAVAWAAGIRSGSHGGPVALEAPDVRFVVLAPIARRTVFLRPCAQRLGSLASTGATVGGLAGVLAAPRLTGSTVTWGVTGVVCGAAVAAGAGALAVLAHAGRLTVGVGQVVATVLVVTQVASTLWALPGPTSVVGHGALWPATQHTSALVGGLVSLGVVALTVAVGLALCGRLRPEALERRASLVAQLRFALAVGDLRTVMLLRRQLAHDQLRRRPWVRVAPPASDGSAVTRVLIWRAAVGLARLPLRRLVRLVAMSVACGALVPAIVDGSWVLVLPLALGVFVVALDLTEGLAQTVDHVEFRQLLPVSAGPVLSGLLIVPALAAVPLSAVALATAFTISGEVSVWSVGAVIALPLAWGGTAGAVVNVVRGAPDPLARAARVMSMPPEVAGLSTFVQTIWPVVVSTAGVAPVLFISDAVEHGGSPMAAAVRGAVASLLVAGAVVVWLRTRDDVRRRWRTLVVAGDAARRQAGLRRRQQREEA